MGNEELMGNEEMKLVEQVRVRVRVREEGEGAGGERAEGGERGRGTGGRAGARSRARVRGGTLVETLLVVPTLGIACSLVVFAGRIYEEKMDALQGLRQVVAAEASGACGRPGERKSGLGRDGSGAGSVTHMKDDATATRTTDGRQFAEVLPKTQHVELTQGTHESAGANSSVFASTVGLFLPQLGVNIPSQSAMVCNETVNTGDRAGMRNISTSTFDPFAH